MQKHTYRRFSPPIIILMAFLTFNSPFISFAQQSGVVTEARIDAERDARMNISGTAWFFMGCFGCVGGVAWAHIVDPLPPASSLLGKSLEYVVTYVDTYRAEAKEFKHEAPDMG